MNTVCSGSSERQTPSAWSSCLLELDEYGVKLVFVLSQQQKKICNQNNEQMTIFLTNPKVVFTIGFFFKLPNEFLSIVAFLSYMRKATRSYDSSGSKWFRHITDESMHQ